jgi:site-specific DNA recombinase
MRAIIYCRVSSQEQVSNLSLPTQEKYCREYCQRQGFTVDQVFVERGESAKTVERPVFREMLAYCRKHKDTTDAVVVYALTRFSRNSTDHYAIGAHLRGLGISLRSVTEPIDDSPAGRFMEGILAAMSQFDNEQRAERTRVGLRASAQMGRWVFKRPLGYLNSPRGKSGPSLAVDTERAPLIRKAFELCAEGRPEHEIRGTITAMGLRSESGNTISKQFLAKILRNPIYAGWISYKPLGERYKGDFQPVVTQELFNDVQRRLSGNPTNGIARRRGQQDFPLRRFVQCARCGKPVTGGWARGRWGNRYAYYYCREKCSRVIARKAKLEDQFVELLRHLVPSPEWVELLKQTILSIWHEELGQVSDVRETIQKHETQIRAKLRRLDEAFIHEASIDRITYEDQRDKLREELTLAELELSETRIEQFDIESALAKAVRVLNNASALWIDASLEDRLRLQEVLFPQGLVWDGTGFQTPATCLSFYQLAPVDEAGSAPSPLDGVQTPPISLAPNELGSETRAGVNDGTGTGIRTPVPWLRTTCPDP